MTKTQASSSQLLAILDAGAQYGKVIDRRVRELAVESHILPLDTPVKDLEQYRAVIISGGPQSVFGDKAPKYDPDLFKLNKPILGVCYGMQLMNHVHGGTVETKDRREDGQNEITIDPSSQLFKGLSNRQKVLLTHGDSVDQLASGFRQIGDSDGLVAAIENADAQLYGVQFHPEVDLSEHGQDILGNFLFEISGFAGNFSVEDREQKAITYLQQAVGQRQALILVSGGVDSTVSATLLTKALPAEQIVAVHIDHGFMRLDESKKVMAALAAIGLPVKLVDAYQEFSQGSTEFKGKQVGPLHSVVDPEEKRNIIGDVFVQVTEATLRGLGLNPENVVLVQGSLRPDLIESASGKISKNADKIKTHHNDARLISELREKGRVAEPLAEYHKDEVRQLGELLGLPAELVWRQPFPGPGLAIRILCADQPYHGTSEAEFEQISAAVRAAVPSDRPATVLPVQTVGVQGDGRTYSFAAAVGGTSRRGGEPNWPALMTLAQKLPQTIHQLNRVVYVWPGKDGQTELPAVVTVTPTRVQETELQQLRQADDIVNQVLLEFDLIRPLSQVPVILLPVSLDAEGQRAIVIRTFITNDFMTGVPAVPGQQMPVAALEKMVSRILAEVPGISRVMYDLTAKPPGTTEWE